MVKRVKTVQESDLRMLGNLARNIQRVLPVTQADIDAAAALGKGWVVWKVFEVSDPLDNMRGGTQLIIRQNSIQPGQNVRRVIFVVGPGGQTVVIRGTDYIVLPDAIANSLSYVKAFGGTEQNGTPTPDAPVDIVSNNGVLKVRRQSGLPSGYTRLEYIEFTGNQWINTGVLPSSNTELQMEMLAKASNKMAYSTSGSTSSVNGMYYNINGSGGVANMNGRSTNFSTSLNTKHKIIQNRNGVTFDNTRYSYNNDVPDFSGTNPLWIGGGAYFRFEGYVYSWRINENGNLVQNLVPARRNSDDVLGMYDTVSGTFFTNAGTGDFVAGNVVNDLEIYTDGTVETINVHGKNLFDVNTMLVEKKAVRAGAVSADKPLGSEMDNDNWNCTDYISVLPDTTYTYTIPKSINAAAAGTVFYSDKSVDGAISGITQSSSLTRTFTTPSNCRYVRFSWQLGNGNDVQLELGSTATAYEPYYDGGTATAEMLLKVGDYQDVQSIIDGAITRNVGVKVLDGTENWNLGSSSERPFYLNSSIDDSYALPNTPFCTHFQGVASTVTSLDMPDLTIRCGYEGYERSLYIKYKGLYSSGVAAFKQFLADQYAAGTPVIVVYPLATPTTESVAGQTLQVTDGDNVLEITQASLDGLELEAQYNAAVSLTIQEVQDANLDNNVTVTIQ